MVHTFKVGDAVKLVSVRPVWSAKVGDTGKIIALFALTDGEPAYIVELDRTPGSRIIYKEQRLELLDEPLPPVPDAIDYREARLPQLYFRAETRCDDLGLTLSMGGPMVLDADSILQLAHDLRRMAMQIKRNQKQEQAQ